jgi:hypothetical protein
LCLVSKEYQQSATARYWYAFHPSQQEFLNESATSFIALGCGSSDQIVLIPSTEFLKYLPVMRTTASGDRFYWHVEIFKKGDKFFLNKPTAEGIDVTQYKMK